MLGGRNRHHDPHRALALRIAAPAIAVWTLSTACVVHIPSANRPAPIGKELIELDRAHKDGLVSDDEYARTRADMLRNFERIGQTPVEPSFPYRDGGSK